MSRAAGIALPQAAFAPGTGPRPAARLTGVAGITFSFREHPHWDADDASLRRHADLIDSLFLRRLWMRITPLSDKVARSQQLTPQQLAGLPTAGFARVITLRGDPTGAVVRQCRACAALGLEMVCMDFNSRRAPDPAQLIALRGLLQQLDRLPGRTLLHCKAGADRTGLVAALYRHWVQGWPIARARQELSWRYGHLAWGRAGILSAFFDDFARAGAGDFDRWLAERYDPAALAAGFGQTAGWRRGLGRRLEQLLRNE